MITIKDFMNCTQHRITEGTPYLWNCYGENAYTIEYCNDHSLVYIVYNNITFEVHEMQAWDYTNIREYRWINPDYIKAYKKECKTRNIKYKNSTDNAIFIDLDVPEDILEKAKSIIIGEDYDTRVQMIIDLDDELLFAAMTMAHEQDITFNQLITEILKIAVTNAELKK